MDGKRHVIVISVDAMITSDLAEFRKRRNMGALLEKSAVAEEMHCIYPTYTYPCHTSIMTGCYPDKHGIYHNDMFDPKGGAPVWFWYSDKIRRKTMIDIARENGLSTSTVVFPVQGANGADWCIPEIWAAEKDADSDEAYRTATSGKAWPIYRKYKGMLNWMKTPEFDLFAAACAADIIREGKPELMFIHFSYLDHQRHRCGAGTPKVLHAIDFIDDRIGDIVSAVEDAGIRDCTDFVILGDHGQIDVHTLFQINMVLANKGYISLDDEGNVIDWRIMVHSTSFSGHVYTKDMEKDEVRRVLEEIREEYPEYIERVMDRMEVKEIYHLDGPFDFVLEAQTHVIFGQKTKGEMVEKPEPGYYKFSVSTHGYAPEKGPNPPFFISGPHAKEGTVVKKARLVDEAPTILGILGLEMEGDIDGVKLDMLK